MVRVYSSNPWWGDVPLKEGGGGGNYTSQKPSLLPAGVDVQPLRVLWSGPQNPRLGNTVLEDALVVRVTVAVQDVVGLQGCLSVLVQVVVLGLVR